MLSTGSLVDYLKTQQGGSLPMNTLIDMASQVRHFFHHLFSYYNTHFTSWIYSFTSSFFILVLGRKLVTVVMRLTFNTNPEAAMSLLHYTVLLCYD